MYFLGAHCMLLPTTLLLYHLSIIILLQHLTFVKSHSGISWLLPNTLVTKAEFDSLSRIPEQVQLRANHKECYLEGFSSTTALELLKFSNDLVAQLDSGQKHNACAILILHGTNDATTSIDGASKFLQWSTNSDKELKLYKDGRHNLTMDLCAKEVFDYCSQWIEKHLP